MEIVLTKKVSDIYLWIYIYLLINSILTEVTPSQSFMYYFILYSLGAPLPTKDTLKS